MGPVVDHCNKVNFTIKRVRENSWFPSAYRSYVYTILYSVSCEIVSCLKKMISRRVGGTGFKLLNE